VQRGHDTVASHDGPHEVQGDKVSNESFIKHSADSCRLMDDGWLIVAAFDLFDRPRLSSEVNVARQWLKTCLRKWTAGLFVVVVALASHSSESAATLSPYDGIEAKTAGATHIAEQRTEIEELVAKADLLGTLNVLVALKLPQPYVPEGQLPDRAAIDRQRAAIAAARESLLVSLSSANATEYRRLDPTSVIALKVDAAAMRLLAASLRVDAIQEDGPERTLSPEYLPELARLTEKVAKTGTVNVIVGLKLPEPYKPESKSLDQAAIDRQRAAIAQARDSLMASLRNTKAAMYGKWDPLPSAALRVDAAALKLLGQSSLITTIKEDRLSKPQ
jgi:hypothetical protein